MSSHNIKINNPLTVIAIFSMLTEASAAVSLPYIDSKNQEIYVWFLIVFPSFLVTLFFITLNFNNKTLYSPVTSSKEQKQQKFRSATHIPHIEPIQTINTSNGSAGHSILLSHSGIKLSAHHPKSLIFLPQGHRHYDPTLCSAPPPNSLLPAHPAGQFLLLEDLPLKSLHLIDLNHHALRRKPIAPHRDALHEYSKKVHAWTFHKNDIIFLLTSAPHDISYSLEKISIRTPNSHSEFGQATVIVYNTLTQKLSPPTQH